VLWDRLRGDADLSSQRGLRAAVDLLDSAMWAHASTSADAPEAVRYHAIASIVPTAVEESMRFRSGTAATPTFGSAQPWPPTSASGSARSIGTIAALALAPAAATRLVRRRAGLRSSLGEDLGWAVLSVAGGFALARARDRLHKEAQSRWEVAVDGTQAASTLAMRAVVANRETSGHAFKTIFGTLADLLQIVGDDEGRATARHELQHCQEQEQLAYDTAAEQIGGTLLAHAALQAGVSVEPISAGVVWLSDREADRLAGFIVEAEEAAVAEHPHAEVIEAAQIKVLQCGWDRALIEVCGREQWFGSSEPTIETNLDPARVGFVYGTALKLTTLLPRFGSVPPGFVIGAVALDIANLRRHLTDPTLSTSDAPPPPEVFARSLAAMAVCALPVALRRTPERTSDGWPLNPAAQHGTLLLLGHYWHHLAPRQRWSILAGCAVAWTYAAWRPERRGVAGRGWEVLAEAMNPLSVFLCALNLDRRVGGESDDLEARLAEDLREALSATHREVLGDYALGLREQLGTAAALVHRTALQLPAHPDLRSIVDELQLRIEAFEAWLLELEADDADAPEGGVWRS
jgi:hypothetical protein